MSLSNHDNKMSERRNIESSRLNNRAKTATTFYGPNTNVSYVKRTWYMKILLGIYSNIVLILGGIVLIAFLLYRFY